MSAACSCHYCVVAQAVTVGDLYCSTKNDRETMDELSSGMFLINCNELHTDDHISRFSLRFVENGIQEYRLGGSRQTRIDPTSYLVINQGQSYATAFKGANVGMYGIAFEPNLVADAQNCVSKTDDLLLDAPPQEPVRPLAFGDRTYDLNTEMFTVAQRVRSMLQRGAVDSMHVAEASSQILHTFFASHNRILDPSDRLQALKPSTRHELFKRLTLGRDALIGLAHTRITMRAVAREAAMSEYHFIRAFGEVFGESPFAFLSSVRMRHAKVLLQTTNHTVTEIADKVGFDNVSSFVRRFRLITGTTPAAYRQTAASLGLPLQVSLIQPSKKQLTETSNVESMIHVPGRNIRPTEKM